MIFTCIWKTSTRKKILRALGKFTRKSAIGNNVNFHQGRQRRDKKKEKKYKLVLKKQ